MAIAVDSKYTDETHVFGIVMARVDKPGANGKIQGSIHRQELLKEEAIAWLKDWIADGGKEEAFFIVASPKTQWELAETGRKLPTAGSEWD